MVGPKKSFCHFAPTPLGWEQAKALGASGKDGLALTCHRDLLVTREEFKKGYRGYYSYRIPDGWFAVHAIHSGTANGLVAGLFLQNY